MNATEHSDSFDVAHHLSIVCRIINCSIVEAVLTSAKAKANVLLKTSGEKRGKLKFILLFPLFVFSGVPKLEDANDVGTKNSIDCTLIVIKDESALSWVTSGLGEIGRDRYGVLPFSGKPLNVREATRKRVTIDVLRSHFLDDFFTK